MKHKLVLIFNDNSEIEGINKRLLFNNEKDAEAYLISTGQIISIKIEPDNTWFEFKTPYSHNDGNGGVYWVVDLTY